MARDFSLFVRCATSGLIVALLGQRAGFAEGAKSIFDDPALLPPAPATAPATTAKAPVGPSIPAPAPPATPTPDVPTAKPAAPNPTLLPFDAASAALKIAVPEGAAQSKMVAVIRQIYTKEYAQKTPAARRALARELLDQADKIISNFAARYALLEEAETAAINGHDVETCRKAIEGIERTFDIDTTNLTITAMASLTNGGDEAPVMEWAADAIEARIGQDNYKTARQIDRAMAGKAARGRESASHDRLKSLETVLAEADRVRPALDKLKTNPEDGAANLAVGRFYCFSRNEWAKGLPLLAKGADPRLADLAKLDLTNPAEASKRYALAGRWWDLGQDHAYTTSQAHLRERAGYWYDQAMADLTGLQHALATKRIEQAANDAMIHGGGPRQLVFESYIDGDTEIHLTPKGIYLKQLAASKPGRNDGHDDPTYLDGKIWKLDWKNPESIRGADITSPLPMMIGKLNFDFEVMAIGNERGKPGIENRSPVTMRNDGGEQVISIPDKQSGARWYTIRIFRK